MAANTILTSVITGGTSNHATTSEELNAVATDFVTPGVVGSIGLNVGSGGTGSFCVNADASPDMGVTVKAGQAYITATPTSQNAQVVRARASADYTTYVINANSSGSTKFDWIYLKVDPTNANTPDAAADNVTSIYTSRSSSNTTDNGSPPTYGLLLAIVTVANGASSITNSNILDKRSQAVISQSGTSATTGWNSLLYTPNTVTYNGNRSYTCVFNGVDLTGSISPGMRLRTTRTVAAPTQCTSLNGTTQYYSKTSPAGMTFTDNYTQMAWVKLSSYPGAGTSGVIMGRSDATPANAWYLEVNTSGQVRNIVVNAGAGNTRTIATYQSLLLNKWVHVAATWAAGTVNIYFDGVLVPVQAAVTAGTAPTTTVQAGDFAVGRLGSFTTSGYFPGKIAQAAVFSAVLSQATIQSYISQGLAGTETSLISAYSFNNTINDLNTTNANNLTANGSAVATNADSPFTQQAGGTPNGTLDYGIIQSASFSTNTTVVVQVPEGNTIPTSGGVSAVSYSPVAAPFGFPKQKGKWVVGSLYIARTTLSTPSNSTWYNEGQQLTVPIGEWTTGYNVYLQTTHAGSIGLGAIATLSTASNTHGDYELTTMTPSLGSSQAEQDGACTAKLDKSFAAQTVMYLNVQPLQSNETIYVGQGLNTMGLTITAENALL